MNFNENFGANSSKPNNWSSCSTDGKGNSFSMLEKPKISFFLPAQHHKMLLYPASSRKTWEWEGDEKYLCFVWLKVCALPSAEVSTWRGQHLEPVQSPARSVAQRRPHKLSRSSRGHVEIAKPSRCKRSRARSSWCRKGSGAALTGRYWLASRYIGHGFDQWLGSG